MVLKFGFLSHNKTFLEWIVGLNQWCDIIEAIDKNKRLEDPCFIEDSNFLAFCSLFEETLDFEVNDKAGILNKKIALLLLGGFVGDRVYRLDDYLGKDNKLYNRVKNLCLVNYEIYLNTITHYGLINKIVQGAPYFFE